MSVEINEYTSGTENNRGDFYSIAKYIPLMTYLNLYHINTELELVSLVLKKPSSVEGDYLYGNSSAKLLSYLSTSVFLRRIETNGLIIHVGKGVIYDDENNILLSLSIETQFIVDALVNDTYNWSSLFEANRNFVGYEPFIMFVSTEFANDKKFAVLYRRIKKIYLDFCFEKGIEMRLISSSKIEKNTFTNNLKIKFNSLTELNRHLTEEVKHLLQTPLENFQENEFPLLLGSPPVPKSKEKKSPWQDFVPQMEDRIEVLNHSRDSMLEDSDRDEEDFGPVVLDVNSLPSISSPSLEELLHETSPLFINTSVTPIPSNYVNRIMMDVDRIMAMDMSILSSNQSSLRDSATEALGVPVRYFDSDQYGTNTRPENIPSITYDSREGLSRDSLEEAINYLASEIDIEQERREVERGDDTDWLDVDYFDTNQEEDEQERDLPY